MLETHDYGGVAWVDVVDPTDDELRQLAHTYGLLDRTFDEAHRKAKRPTLQRFDDHAYVVAFSGALAEIDMYIGDTWFITIRNTDPDTGREWDPSPAMQRFVRRCSKAPDSGRLMITVLDELVDGYFDRTDAIEDGIEHIEDKIFGETSATEKEIQHRLFEKRRDLLELRRAISPLREVLSAIAREELPWVAGAALVECRDTLDKLLRAMDLVDDQRELIGNAMDAHLAVMSNQMNLVMKKLTAYGSIVFGATLIAGIYGMNFEHMPELHWRFGYPFALGAMGVISLLLYRMFRKRDWL